MNGEMTAAAVLDAMAALERAGIPAWIGGGWGVDALLGEQTRVHRDLDLAIDAAAVGRALDALLRDGCAIALDLRPVRIVVETVRGESIDIHPVVFDAAGFGRQSGDDGRVFEYPPDGFAEGSIAGRQVRCLSAAQLVRFHLGYEPLEHDRADMRLLRDRLGVDLPPLYD